MQSFRFNYGRKTPMTTYYIPIEFKVSGLKAIEADNLNDAIYHSMGYDVNISQTTDIKPCGVCIPITDNQRLQEMYPEEYAQMKEDEKPDWEKRGWTSPYTDCWEKNGIRITNSFDDVGWGFEGSVHFPGGESRGTFISLEDAINYAESRM